MKFDSFINVHKSYAKEKAKEESLKLTSAQQAVAKELGFTDWQKLTYNLKKLHEITLGLIDIYEADPYINEKEKIKNMMIKF
jgi:hypothetical protein